MCLSSKVIPFAVKIRILKMMVCGTGRTSVRNFAETHFASVATDDPTSFNLCDCYKL